MSSQQQVILRLPPKLAKKVRKLLTQDNISDDQLNSLINIEPDEGNDCFIFTFQDTKYPALLQNLPTVVETHKTYDRKIFLKSGDVGQMLQVFDSAKDRSTARNKLVKSASGYATTISGTTGSNVMANGLTPPTTNIVKERFELTRKNIKNSDIYSMHRVKEVIADVSQQWYLPEEDEVGAHVINI
jgi:transcription initiation factor TFIID subunit 7